MKLYILVILLSFNAPIFSHNSKTNNKIDSIIQSKINKEIELSLKKIDSLNKKIEIYKINENYYSTALSTQTGIFSIIVAVLTFLIGFISYNKFKMEVKNVKEQYKKTIKEYSKFKKEQNLISYELYGLLGILHNTKGSKGESIKFLVKAISSGYNIKNNTEEVKGNIKELIQIINTELSNSDINDLKKDTNIIIKYLNETKTIKDDEINNLLAKLRVCIITKTS